MARKKTILCLAESDLEQLDITPEEAVWSIEMLIHGVARSKAWSAPKAVIQPPDGRYMMAALAAADDPPYLAVKTVILNPRNSDIGLPQINGLVTMLDSDTGLPLAVVDGNWITAVRTAGLSAVAARRMANPDATTAAFVGCGVQARSHLKAFAAMFPLREVKVFGRGRPNIEALCSLATSLGLNPTVAASGQEAIVAADLVISSVTYTVDLEPFLDARGLAPGAFAAITDLGAPWIKEGLRVFDRVAIDDLEQEAAMSSKLIQAELVTGDLSGLVLGKFAGRANADERTAFIFRAHALGDLALASLAYRKARELALGATVAI